MNGPFFPIVLLQAGGSGLLNLAPFVLIFAIFYFLVIAPQRKRQKALQATIAELKKGDLIITSGGLYGEVVSTDDDTLVMKVAENVKIKIGKSAVSGLQGDPQTEGSR